MTEFRGAGIKMTESDIRLVADEKGLEFAVLKAVLEVESAGDGFDKAGRPKALFERHHFYRHLKLKPVERDQAVAMELAYPTWGEKPYPKGSDSVYKEISAAYEIDAEAALWSTSWGLGQVMGSNFKKAGCENVAKMLAQAMHSEEQQLRHMVNFCEASGLIPALQAKDWVSFAKGYNGPGYQKNQYHVKLEKAFQRNNY